MHESPNRGPDKTYRVRVGLAECTVSCRTRQEAIQRAREHLNREMPRLATIISGILDKEFRVDQVG